ncbi:MULTISPECIES: universal stress protein [Halorussus]|uniref:universal stress protein n=1 Tax=Halorussus TaxID=1070314 RepID=UPI000E217127|nr:MULTISPECIES: universal stress protein [Halorussus]NHN58195.1 universal stress protein [Halorussus sp. JP-T4]
MYDTLLVPTDGSEHAERAAEHALTLARAFDATVHLINVVDVQDAGGLFSAGGVDEAFVGRLEDEARDIIADLEALAEPGDDVQTAVVRNRPSKGILAYADEHDVDLVFMGTHGRTGVNRYVMGSVAERIVRLSEVPVFTVRATERSVLDDGYDDVMIPTDGSDCAELAVDHGIAVAEKFDATVHAVYVVDIRAAATASDAPGETGLLSRLEEQGREATDAIAERAREAGLDATTAVGEGVPASGLVDYVDEEGVDLVAMGTHGRTGFDRYFMGSTAAKVVRTSEVPVLSVRAADRDDE